MGKVICIKHRKYDGKTAPDLGCKPCCSKYVAIVKEAALRSQKVVR